MFCRWFVLKQGKIFWFKSDIVTPVRAQASQFCGCIKIYAMWPIKG